MRRKSRVSGSYPRRLYRFFDQQAYADEFVNGRFRVWSQARYLDSSLASRSDAQEGISSYLKMGIEHQGSFTNPVFVLCCSMSDVHISKLQEKFGAWVVVIHNPIELAIDLDHHLNGDGTKLGVQIFGAEVEYTKGLAVHPDSETQRLVELALIQKPPSYQNEREFRYCLVDMLSRVPAEYIDVNLGAPLRYAKILT